jgi:hypothetical protein
MIHGNFEKQKNKQKTYKNSKNKKKFVQISLIQT